MSDQQSGTTPSEATRAEEEKEASAAHVAGRGPTPEEDAAARSEAGEGVAEHYEEMRQRGADERGEGRLP